MHHDRPDTHGQRPDLAQAAAHLRAGLPVVFPTDTVAGIGVSVRHAPDPQALFAIKGRDETKPIAWLVGSVDDLALYGTDVPECAFELARAFWPGALTLVVKASEQVPLAFQSSQGTIGLRMPDHELALALVRQVGCPLATSSANPSGAAAPGSAQHVDETVRRAAACVLEGGSHATGRASTVLDCTGGSFRILREGDISAMQLAAHGYTCP